MLVRTKGEPSEAVIRVTAAIGVGHVARKHIAQIEKAPLAFLRRGERKGGRNHEPIRHSAPKTP